MRTYCKRLDLLGDAHLSAAYEAFARGKRNKPEFGRFFERPRAEVFDEARAMVRARLLTLPAITYFERTEPTNGKVRLIARESAMQQFMDYVCVTALQPMLDAKVGYHQCGSVRGKGQAHARRYVERWVRDRRSRWYAKLDVRKYYPSVDRARLMAMLRRDVRDEDLLWLVEALLSTHGQGLNIGSYLSQALANYYLSGMVRMASEAARERRSRRRGEFVRERLVSHILTYMDDVLIVGHDKANVKACARLIVRYLRDELGLEAKPWKVCSVDCEPVDICGFVFRRDRVTVRAGIFLRGRRALLAAKRARRVTPMAAARCVSYWGYFKHSDTRLWQMGNDIQGTVERCKRVVSAAARNGGFHERGLGVRGAGARRTAPAA